MDGNQELRGGMGSTNLQAARDIRVGLDAQEVRKLVEDVTDAINPNAARPPLPLHGWVSITPHFLAKRKPRADLADYFDGSAPDWRDICHPNLRPRPAVTAAVQAFPADGLEDRSLLLRIGGATGDGKSTVLQQAVALLTQQGRFDAIYWRSNAEARLSAEAVATMGASHRTILVASDDAEALLVDIDRFARLKLHEDETFIHFLLASRDVDWNAERDRLGWKFGVANRWAPSFHVLPPIILDRVEQADAQVIAANWLNCSSSRPARLKSGDLQQISRATLDASRASEGRQAFMGGVLFMRFDSERLRLRLTSLLSTLDTLRPGDPAISLADFMVLLAAIDVSTIEGVPRDVAARFLNVSESELRPFVQVPLKREFFVGASSRAFFARHPSISMALLELALGEESTLRVESSLGKFLADVRYVGEHSGYRPGFGKLTDLGHRLLGSSVSRDLVGELALHLSRTACAVAPRELSTFIALSQTIREQGEPRAALTEVWEDVTTRLDDPNWWRDYADHGRSAWAELSTTLGASDNYWPAYWAATVAISDRLSTKLDPQTVSISLNLLSLNARRAWERGADRDSICDLLIEADALTSMVGSPFYDERRHAARNLEKVGIPSRQFGGPDALAAAIQRTAGALRTSQQSLPWCDHLVGPKDNSFGTLVELLGRQVR